METKVRDANEERERLINQYVKNARYSGFATRADGINHIAFVVRDVDKTIEFYTQIVGLKLLRVRQLDGDEKSTMIFFDLGKGEFLAFLKLYNLTKRATMGIGGVHHFAVTVTRTQYDEFKKRAEASGLKYKTFSHEILDSISALDPNGIEVELSVWNIDPSQIIQELPI